MASGLNLFVVPLDKSVDDDILRRAFSEYGELFSAQVARDENGVSKNFGFVQFCSVSDGLRAKEEMNNKKFFGTTIHVKIGHKQESNENQFILFLYNIINFVKAVNQLTSELYPC